MAEMKLFHPFWVELYHPTWMSQEVNKRLGSVGYNPKEYPIYK